MQRPIESTYPSSPSNPQPAAPADRGAQWPICAEVPRKKISICGRRGGGEGGESGGEGGTGVSGAHVNAPDGSAAGRGLENVLLRLFPSGRQAGRQEPPSLFANLYLLALYVHLSARQTKHVILGPHQLDNAHTQTQTSIHGRKRPADKVKLAEGCEWSKGHGGGFVKRL